MFRRAAVLACLCLGMAVIARAEPTEATCAARSNETQARLLACIGQDSLWRHLKAFQKIADANPDHAGHGNRDTGTAGYKASIDYVARLLRKAGYRVRIQSYPWKQFAIVGQASFEANGSAYAPGQDFLVARLSGSGIVTAAIAPVGQSGCSGVDFASFPAGNIALLERGACSFDEQVANAQTAGAAAVVIYNTGAADEASQGKQQRDGRLFEAMLGQTTAIPVITVSNRAGLALAHEHSLRARIAVETRARSGTDYNLIADSPYGDAAHTMVVDAHLDSIYGAGMLDNASGSTTILDIALALAHTQTLNRLRYIWFGGEELGLLGSKFYTQNLSPRELRRTAFDIDVDVTATPNFDVLIADPANAHNANRFPPNVIPESKVGNRAFAAWFRSAGIASRNASFGNDGTDSNSFSLAGVPNSGILTQQDCCKHDWEVALWGGFTGNYEGQVPGNDGGCVDWPRRWCDNLSNNDAFVLTFVSKAVAAVVLDLANDPNLGRRESVRP